MKNKSGITLFRTFCLSGNGGDRTRIPYACKASAQPIELRPQNFSLQNPTKLLIVLWKQWGSNPYSSVSQTDAAPIQLYPQKTGKVYKSVFLRALPTELFPHFFIIAGKAGLEPTTTAFQLRCNSYYCHCFILSFLSAG